jgi:hypothetical protein
MELYNVVFLSVVLIYILHQLIKRGPGKRFFFAIVLFSIFSLCSFFAAGGMTQPFAAPSRDLEAASAMEPVAAGEGPGKTPLAQSVVWVAMANI